MARPEYANSANPLHTGLHIALYLYLYFYSYTLYFLRLCPFCIALLSILESVAPSLLSQLQNEFVALLKSLQAGSTEA